jgi:hypothetical protein
VADKRRAADGLPSKPVRRDGRQSPQGDRPRRRLSWSRASASGGSFFDRIYEISDELFLLSLDLYLREFHCFVPFAGWKRKGRMSLRNLSATASPLHNKPT